MEISYRSKKIQKIFESEDRLVKAYGRTMANKINQRLSEVQAASNPRHLPPVCRFHEHGGNRKGLFSIDLVHPFRLIVRPTCNYEDWEDILSVVIWEVIDPH